MDFRVIHQDHEFEIRPLHVGEAPLLLDAVRSSLAEIGRWESWCVDSYSLKEASSFLCSVASQWAEGSAFDFNVVSLSSGIVLGSVSVNQINRQNKSGNIGYWTRTSHAQRGIASLAATAVSRFAFSQLGLTRLEIVAQEENIPSRRVAERIGATFECLARNRLVFRGEPRAATVFSIVPGDLHG